MLSETSEIKWILGVLTFGLLVYMLLRPYAMEKQQQVDTRHDMSGSIGNPPARYADWYEPQYTSP